MDEEEVIIIENWSRDVLATPIDEMSLSIRSYNRLIWKGIKELHQLVVSQPSELLKIRGFGMASLREVKRHMHSRGLRFCQTVRERNKVAEIMSGLAVAIPVEPRQPTLRQIYAAHALQGLIEARSGEMPDNEIVSQAFWYADAMLYHEAKEREGK